MRLSKLVLAAAIVAATGAVAFAPAASADNAVQSTGGKITIQGKVINATCSFGTSGADQTVVLPTVSQADLNAQTAAGQYAAVSKGFTIDLKDCPTNATVGVQFYSTYADTTTGYGTLTNASGTASNVDVQIVDSDSSAVTIASTQPTDNTGVSDATDMSTNNGTASLSYTTYYYVTNAGNVAAGSVDTFAQYVLNYQ